MPFTYAAKSDGEQTPVVSTEENEIESVAIATKPS